MAFLPPLIDFRIAWQSPNVFVRSSYCPAVVHKLLAHQSVMNSSFESRVFNMVYPNFVLFQHPFSSTELHESPPITIRILVEWIVRPFSDGKGKENSHRPACSLASKIRESVANLFKFRK